MLRRSSNSKLLLQILVQPALFKLIEIYLLVAEDIKLLNFPNKSLNIHEWEDKNSAVCVIKLSLLTTITSSLSFNPHYKNDRALPVNLLK